MNGYGFLAITALMFISFGLFLTTCSVQKRPDDSKSPVIVDTNSIGCNKYSFKGDEYWKCPKQLDIDYVEEHHNTGKTTSTRYIPVTNMEEGK